MVEPHRDSWLLFAAGAVLGLGSGAGAALRPASAQTPAPSLERVIGQHIVARVPGTRPSAAVLRRIRAGRLGGVIVFADNAPSARALRTFLRRLDAAARAGGNPPLLVVVDQEGGSVRRLAGPPTRSAAQLGAGNSPDAAFREGVATARLLRGVGVRANLAPVLDVPSSSASFLGERAYSRNRFVVSSIGVAFTRGLRAGGVAATAKHFPGLGTATRTTDERPVAVLRSRRELDRRLLPFRVAVRSGIELVMVSNASYPAYDRSRAPAVFSRPILQGLLREQLGFRGLVISDDLEGGALASYTMPATSAVRAGVDLVLFARSKSGGERAYAELLAAARNGKLDPAQLERSYDAIVAFKRRRGLDGNPRR